MALNIEANSCGVDTIEGVTVFGFTIGDIRLEIDDTYAAMPGSAAGRLITAKNTDEQEIVSREYADDSSLFNGGFLFDPANKTISSDEVSFTDDIIIFVASVTGYDPTPAGWVDVARDSEPSDFVAPMGVSVSGQPTQLCPGTTGSIDVQVSNDGFCDSLKNTSVTVTNELTGNSTTKSYTRTAGDVEGTISWVNSVTESFEYTIPDDASLGDNIELLTIEADSDAPNAPITRTVTTTIGNKPENLFLDDISDISGKCAGDRFGPSVVARNGGVCEANLKVEIVNNVTDDVITTDFTSVGTGGQDPGSSDYYISENIPDIPSDVNEIVYEANLVRDA